MRSLAGPVPTGWAEWGVDVSDANELTVANWDWIADNGASFAFIKSYDGARGNSTKTSVYVKECLARHIEPGMYWFLSPPKVAPIRMQCMRFVATLSRHESAMPRMLVGIDIENGKGRVPWTREDEPLRNLKQAAWLLKEELGTRPFLYHGKSFGDQWGIHRDPSLGKYPLWASRWPKRPDRTDITLEQVTREFGREPACWQYGGSGASVSSPIPKLLDKNVCPQPLKRER